MAVTSAVGAARRRRGPTLVAWALWVLSMLGLGLVVWLDHLLRRAALSELGFLGPSSLPELVATVSAATVGAVLAVRRPAHPVGWLLLAIGLLSPATSAANEFAHYGVMARHGTLPVAAYLAGVSNAFIGLGPACAGFIGLLTPTGSLPSPGWRWWARVAATGAAVFLLAMALDQHPLTPEEPNFENPLFIPALRGPLPIAQGASAVIILANLVVAAASLVVRYRRARGIERQQLRWVAFGTAMAGVALLAAVASAVLSKGDVIVAFGLSLALLPLATGAAILRYRLYDLDRIISRTLAYGLLTVLLGGAYAGVVLGLGQLVGRNSSLVAAATLALAAVFQPARRRVQAVVDRRFNRRRYDAARTMAAFAAQLRQQIDLDSLAGELLRVVEQTMQPASASLWLRPPIEAPSAHWSGVSAVTIPYR